MMKLIAALSVSILLSAGPLLGQTKEHDMGGKNMDAMQGESVTHHAVGVVKAVDAQSGKLTLAHGPVKTLGWPAMTMIFTVRDHNLLAKLAPSAKVEVDFVEDGKDYVVTKVTN